MKVMSAIEHCRTAALGGHVARCENDKCAHMVIVYNSCRNRHCPKCQGAAAKAWLAEREAELLPVGYFRVVFTLPAPIADIAYQNKAVIYDLLFKASAETVLTIAADPKHLGAHIGITAVLHTWGSTMTHHPHLHMIVPGGGISRDGQRWVSGRPRFLLPVPGSLTPVPEIVPGQAPRRPPGRPPASFSASTPTSMTPERFKAYLAPLRKIEWFLYAKPPFGGPEAVLALSLALYPPRRHLQPPADRLQPQRRHLQVQGLSRRWPRAIQSHDARHARVHPPLSHPRPAARLPPHPPLRTVCQ